MPGVAVDAVFGNSAGAGRGVRLATTDGRRAEGGAVPLRDEGQTHEVRVVLG